MVLVPLNVALSMSAVGGYTGLESTQVTSIRSNLLMLVRAPRLGPVPYQISCVFSIPIVLEIIPG